MKLKILKLNLLIFIILFILTIMPLEGADIFTGNFKDYKIDSDGDGQADELCIDIELNVPKDDNKYLIRGFLMNKADYNSRKQNYSYQHYSKYNLSLKQGRCIITLHFDGYRIFKDKMDGPYSLADVYFGRYLASTPKDIYEDLDSREVVHIPTSYKYTEFEQPDLSFRGRMATFGLRLGKTVRVVEGNIGSVEIKLLSINPNSVKISLNSFPHNDWRPEMIIGKDVSFITGGLEQTGTLKLLEIKDSTAKFEISFGSAPPAPKIRGDMPIDIIYLE